VRYADVVNLYKHLVDAANAHPDKVALLDCDLQGNTQSTITYAELVGRINTAAAGLAVMGFRPSDRVALALDNPTEHLLVTWAAWCMGITTVPLDLKRDTPELAAYKVKASGARLTLTELPAAAPAVVEWAQGDEHEALVLFTSGTTANPKGARLTLSNLITNAQDICTWLKIKEDDRFLVLLPLHHINSTTFSLATLLARGSIAVVPAYSSSNFWRQAANTGATLTSIVQSILFDQLARTNEYSEAKAALKLSRIQIGSSPVVASSVEEFLKLYKIPLYQGYGQTETALRVTGVPMDLPPRAYAQAVVQNSIGTAMPWAEVAIADKAGRMLGEGQEGELVVRGKAVMQGYVGGEEAFRDGYFLTGDLGYWSMIDGQKFFFLKGRKKEIIIKGGINISPVAVENSLKKISPDVAQAYVVGVRDPRYGEVPAAVICWKEGVHADDAMRRLKLLLALGTEHLSEYEVPAYLLSLASEELPLTSTGKVQRLILKERFAAHTPEPLNDIFKTAAHRFVLIHPHSVLAGDSFALYNHCWQPLTKTKEQYKEYLAQHRTLGALDTAGKLAGQITFDKKQDSIECISICSAAYIPKPAPKVQKLPTPDFVRTYLTAGLDPVINFHLRLGASVRDIIPDGRPDDKSALGYLVRMRYPTPKTSKVNESAPVAQQLIELVLLCAQDLTIPYVDALSRPGGLAAHLAAAK